jgi:hypothetical protein
MQDQCRISAGTGQENAWDDIDNGTLDMISRHMTITEPIKGTGQENGQRRVFSRSNKSMDAR